MGYSPDRVDALVWALTELMIEGQGARRLLIG
jgi:phage terminase large subunit-like protein